MKHRIAVSAAANRDIDAHGEFISRSTLKQALRFFDAVAISFRRLAENPGLGVNFEFQHFQAPDLRVWAVRGFPRHLIFFRVKNDRGEVLRLLHGAQHVDSIFEQ